MKSKTLFRLLGIVSLVCAALPLGAQQPTIPPTLDSVWPKGLERGATATFTLDGRNLTGAKVLFDSGGLTGKILSITDLPEQKRVARPGVDFGAIVPEGVKQEAKLEVAAAKDTEAGIHWFRVQTSLGTSNMAVLDVGSLAEVYKPKMSRPGNGEAQPVELPATLVGTLEQPGDTDTYQFSGKAGQEMVFQVVASQLGSRLRSGLVLRDAAGQVIAKSGFSFQGPDAVLTSKLPADGKYTISVSDLEKGGGMDHFYRLNAGALPYVTGVFPLGVRAGQPVDVSVWGVNLGDVRQVKVQPPARADGWTTVPVEVATKWGKSLNEVKLAVGNEPETTETEPNNSPADAQLVTVPVTINGHIFSDKKAEPPDEDYFRFHAKKGQRLIIEVSAARLGSPLDSVVEVLDAQGRDIPRATIRCLDQTQTTLADRDSKSMGLRLLSLAGLHDNDYLMAGDELVQIDRVPDQPDADVTLKGFGGQRISMLDTSPQVHPVNESVYKVKIEAPGAVFPPNGLPVLHPTLRNDDGGPGFGSDSRLHFVAPQDGEYVLHLRDVRGLEGPDFAYRLTVREDTPDFTITAMPGNPNVPRGGRVPVEVFANRTLGYTGPIEIIVKGLPKGITTEDAALPAGQAAATVIFKAAPDAPLTETATPFKIEGRAKINGREVVRVADDYMPLRVAAVMPPPDLVVSAEPREITIEPGKTVTVSLRVDRKNGFAGRVPCNVRNLPPGVVVDNVGLNGVLVTEDQTSRTFTLRAEDWASPLDQPIYVVGEVESNSPTTHASTPLLLRVQRKQMASAGTTPSAKP
jgi:hypothetical protein